MTEKADLRAVVGVGPGNGVSMRLFNGQHRSCRNCFDLSKLLEFG